MIANNTKKQSELQRTAEYLSKIYFLRQVNEEFLLNGGLVDVAHHVQQHGADGLCLLIQPLECFVQSLAVSTWNTFFIELFQYLFRGG